MKRTSNKKSNVPAALLSKSERQLVIDTLIMLHDNKLRLMVALNKAEISGLAPHRVASLRTEYNDVKNRMKYEVIKNKAILGKYFPNL
jgi:hypothetical protein